MMPTNSVPSAGRTVQDAVLIDDDDDDDEPILLASKDLDPPRTSSGRIASSASKMGVSETKMVDLTDTSGFSSRCLKVEESEDVPICVGARAPIARMVEWKGVGGCDAMENLDAKAGGKRSVELTPKERESPIPSANDTKMVKPVEAEKPICQPSEHKAAECLLPKSVAETQALVDDDHQHREEKTMSQEVRSADPIKKREKEHTDITQPRPATSSKPTGVAAPPVLARPKDNIPSEPPRGFAALVQSRAKASAIDPARQSGPPSRPSTPISRQSHGPPVIQARSQARAKASAADCRDSDSPKNSHIPPTGIDISTEPPRSKKRPHNPDKDAPFDDPTFLRPSKKLTLGSISVDTVFAPSQIASKREIAEIADARRDAKRQRRLEKHKVSLQDDDKDDRCAVRCFVDDEPEEVLMEKTDASVLGGSVVPGDERPSLSIPVTQPADHRRPICEREKPKQIARQPEPDRTEIQRAEQKAAGPATGEIAPSVHAASKESRSTTSNENLSKKGPSSQSTKSALTVPAKATEPRPKASKGNLSKKAEEQPFQTTEKIKSAVCESRPTAGKKSLPKVEEETIRVTDDEASPVAEPRPTTSRKTLPKAAEAHNVANHHVEGTMPHDPNDHFESVSSVYHYYVTLRNSQVSDSTAVEKLLGPFLTLEEANAVAGQEVRYLIADGNDVAVFDIQEYGRGWSFQHAVDERGLVTCSLSVGGLVAEASVSRDIAPANQRYSLPTRAFNISAKVYLVLEAFRHPSYSSIDIDPDSHRELTVTTPLNLGCFTTFDRANRRAGEQWLAAESAQMTVRGNSSRIERSELGSRLRRDLEDMAEDGELWRRVVVEEWGERKIERVVWVEEVEVEGPRN